MKKKMILIGMLITAIGNYVSAQDSQFLHFDLTVTTGIPIIFGYETQKLYIGASVMPEFRIRVLPGDEPLNIFGAIGYSGVNALFNPSDNADNSGITASPFSDIPIYFSAGIVFNVPSGVQKRLIGNIKTGITNIVFGLGYMNTKIGIDASSNELYDAGVFFYLGVATNILSFGFY
jgi:hypothetical protein